MIAAMGVVPVIRGIAIFIAATVFIEGLLLVEDAALLGALLLHELVVDGAFLPGHLLLLLIVHPLQPQDQGGVALGGRGGRRRGWRSLTADGDGGRDARRCGGGGGGGGRCNHGSSHSLCALRRNQNENAVGISGRSKPILSRAPAPSLS